MSKNIVIQEGGVGRQFTASKLTTPLVDGGNCNWVPEDEVQLGTKSITENGTYIAANDGKYGYSQVTVNVTSAEKIIAGTTDSGEPVVTTIDVVDGNISEIILGDYFIVTYDEDGKVAKIEDNNGNACVLTYNGETLSGFKDIENNQYTIVLDGNGNISQVIDQNGQECELKDRDNDGKIDIISIGSVMRVVEDEDSGGVKIIDANDNDVTENYIGTSITGVDESDTGWRANITNNTGGGGTSGSSASVGITPVAPATTPGASIAGIDATTGNETVATVDNNGNIKVEDLPSSIKIETPPTKKDYMDGDAMDYSGIVVKAYMKDGTLWKNTSHPDGIIPVGELTFPETKASISKATIDKGTRTIDGVSVEVTKSIVFAQYVDGHLNRAVTNTCPDGVLIMKTPIGETVAISDTYDSAVHYVHSQDGEYRYREAERGTQGFNAITYDVGISAVTGNPMYYGLVEGRNWAHGDVWSVTVNPELETPTGLTKVQAADIALHGAGIIGGGEMIPVVWKRPGDASPLEDSFQISVIEHITPNN